jgi:hypothetical protein
MPRKLNVYRTPIGFHDAYVAAPSQKAALEAWGSDANLFARGVAEEVTDPALTEEPLAHPGEVIRRLRGSLEEQVAALPPDAPKARADVRPTPAKPAKPKPRPSRDALDTAEAALADAEANLSAREADLARREEALQREREALRAERRERLGDLERTRDEAQRGYDRAIEAWRAAN